MRLSMHTLRQSGNHTHKECVHFNKGFCTLNSIPVNPDQPACLRFTSKDVTIASSAARPHIQSKQIRQLYPQPTRTLNIQGYLQTPTFQSCPILYTMSSRGAGARGRRGRRGGDRGHGRGRRGGFAAGPGGSCV